MRVKGAVHNRELLSNVSVFMAFAAFSFFSFTLISPIVSSNADTNTASATSGPYTMSISASDNTPINITPTSTQTVYTGTNTITYSNSCPYGFNVTMSADSEDTNLTRVGEDSATKIIPSTTTTSLTDNTWGYSTDGGTTYNQIPALTNPATIISTSSSTSPAATIDILYGIKTDSSLPSGKYTNDLIYTISVKPQCIVYDLKWDLNGGTGASGASYDDAEINYGRSLNLKNYKPTKTGYDFAGWKSSVTGNTFSADAETVDVNPTNAEEVTLTAQWTPINYPISYALNGGSATNPTSYTIETNTITLNNPTKSYYTFAGWTGSNGTTKQTTVTIPKGSTGNKSYTANWTPTNYTISYTMNGGSCSSPKTSYNIETATFALCTPTRNGYNFAGWTGSNGSTKQTSVSIPKGSTGNKSYTANWTVVTYTISYTLNSGSASNPTSYTIETNTFTLNNPTRSGYVFTGWGGTGLSGSANKTVTISKGSTGNRSYTANWQASLSAISKMQDMTTAICNATTTGTSKTLTDTRDSNTYTVKKLADGKCWMTQNLRLINKTISSSDSNLSSGTWTVPASSTSSSSSAYLDSTYGGYYNFYAVTAGTGGINLTSGNAPSDICPKGWRLPTGGSSGELKTLYNSYNSLALMQGTPGFVLSGYFDNGRVKDQGSRADYWSSTASASNYAYGLSLDSHGYVFPEQNSNKGYACTVRCVAK